MRAEVDAVVSGIEQIAGHAKDGDWEYVWQHMTDELRCLREGRLDGRLVAAKNADRMIAKTDADAADKQSPGSWDTVFAARTEAVGEKYAAAEQATGARKMSECVKLIPELARDYTCLAPKRVSINADRAEIESPNPAGDTTTVVMVRRCKWRSKSAAPGGLPMVG